MNAQTITSPVLLDAALALVGQKLQGVAWLDNIYGQCELIPRPNNERERVFAIYAQQQQAGVHDYVELMPSEALGNYCFFYPEKRQARGVATGAVPKQQERRAKLAMIVFWDYRTVYESDHGSRTVDHIVNEVEQALISTREYGMIVAVTETETRFSEVWKPAAITDIDAVLLRRPYGCARLTLEIAYFPNRLNC